MSGEGSAAPKKLAVRFYRTPGGNEPVREFLKDLSKADTRTVGADLMTVEFGWPVGMPTCRPMGDGLHEVRTRLSGGRELRVLFFVERRQAILLHAFFKTTRTTPRKDLDLALERMRACQTIG